MKDLARARWTDHPDNPLIEPPRASWMIADPTVLEPERTPDWKWHMYANSVGFIHHYVSADGLKWSEVGGRLFQGMRPYLFAEGGSYYLFYERFLRPWHTGIALRRSTNLSDWDEPRMLLVASGRRDGRGIRFLGNPCLVRFEQDYRLYFSSGWIFLRDCLFFEPRYIGYATAPSILGPYTRHSEPLLAPEPDHPYRNFGAGSLKVVGDGAGGWWAFNNGIYRDRDGRSRSAIMLLRSDDGLNFRQIGEGPIIAPEPGWKRALVYAFAPVFRAGEVRLYYNARDGWFRGRERIGLATARDTNDHEKRTK